MTNPAYFYIFHVVEKFQSDRKHFFFPSTPPTFRKPKTHFEGWAEQGYCRFNADSSHHSQQINQGSVWPDSLQYADHPSRGLSWAQAQILLLNNKTSKLSTDSNPASNRILFCRAPRSLLQGYKWKPESNKLQPLCRPNVVFLRIRGS